MPFSIELAGLASGLIGLITYLVRQMVRLRGERDKARLELSSLIAKQGSSEKISMPKLLSLMQRQGEKCALTGIQLTPDNARLDRIKSTVGDYENGNVQILLKEVAAMRGAITGDQKRFIALCCAVAAYAKREEGDPK